jgi:hypothetical protein
VYRFYNRTKYRTNYGYSDGRVVNRGVNIDLVRRRSGQNIRERTVERVNDPGQLRNTNGRNSDRVRSYYVERNNLVRENVDGRRIERSNRRTSLDISRMGIDERNNNSSIERRRDTQGEIIMNNREAQLYKRQMNEQKARSNVRERELRKERSNNSEINRDRSIQRNRNEKPAIRQERKVQKPEYNRSQRQVDRKRDNNQNDSSKNTNRDKNKRGR